MSLVAISALRRPCKSQGAQRVCRANDILCETGDISARRHVARHLHDRKTVQELFGRLLKVRRRPAVIPAVLKLGQRTSDSAEMAFIELVGFEGFVRKKEEQKAKQKEEKAKKKEKKIPEADSNHLRPRKNDVSCLHQNARWENYLYELR